MTSGLASRSCYRDPAVIFEQGCQMCGQTRKSKALTTDWISSQPHDLARIRAAVETWCSDSLYRDTRSNREEVRANAGAGIPARCWARRLAAALRKLVASKTSFVSILGSPPNPHRRSDKSCRQSLGENRGVCSGQRLTQLRSRLPSKATKRHRPRVARRP